MTGKTDYNYKRSKQKFFRDVNPLKKKKKNLDKSML